MQKFSDTVGGVACELVVAESGVAITLRAVDTDVELPPLGDDDLLALLAVGLFLVCCFIWSRRELSQLYSLPQTLHLGFG